MRIPSPADMPGAVIAPRNVVQVLAGLAADIPQLPPREQANMQIVHDVIAEAVQQEKGEKPAPTNLTRHQQLRRIALDLSVRHYGDTDCDPGEVLATAQEWAHWIRTGYPKDGTD